MESGNERDAMAQTEISQLFESLNIAWVKRDYPAFLARLCQIRARARRIHQDALVDLLSALERALQNAVLGRAGYGTIGCYLERLDDALGCTAADNAAREALLASVAVRRLL